MQKKIEGRAGGKAFEKKLERRGKRLKKNRKGGKGLAKNRGDGGKGL